MQYTYAAAALLSFVLAPSALADECAQKCKEAHDMCLGAPGSNKSTCASDYASCLGYNPYEKQPFVEPSACARSSATGTAASATQQQPAVATVAASPEQCECARRCTAEHNKCVTAPGSNKSTCAAEYASCLGYNPYERQPYMEPSACTEDAVKRPERPGGDECAKECTDKKNRCLATPGSNKSTCAAEFAACLGYNPYDEQPHVEPTACSKGQPTATATATGSVAPGGTGTPGGGNGSSCVAQCEDAKNQCLGTPGSNKSTCVSDSEACKARCRAGPSQTSALPPMVTAAGSRARPVVGLVALAAAALL